MSEQMLSDGEYVIPARDIKRILERTSAGFGVIKTGRKKTNILPPEEAHDD